MALASLRARVARCERSRATGNCASPRLRLAPAAPRPRSDRRDHHQTLVVVAEAAAEAAASQAPPPVDPLPPLNPGDAVVQPGPALSVRASEPFYEFTLRYAARPGGPLYGARRVVAHFGHSGWRDARDAEMRPAMAAHGGDNDNNNNSTGIWEATVRVPASALPSAGHAELQVAFRGLLPRFAAETESANDGGENADATANAESANTNDEQLFEEWDNNDGANWTVAVELDTERGHGLAAAPPELTQSGDPEAARWLKSSLLLRVDALAAARALSSEQAALLRALAWAGDFSLLRAYAPLMHSSDDAAVAAALARRCGALSRGRPGVHAVHIATEAAPFAKVGGLGDVTTALAKSHQASGALVELVLPKYDVGNYGALQGLRVVRELTVPWGAGSGGNGHNNGNNNGNNGSGSSGNNGNGVRTLVWSALMDGLPVYLIEPLDGRFWRGACYGCPDDADRFAFFSRAALEFLSLPPRGPSVDVLHAHDYHTAPIAVMMREGVRDHSNGNGANASSSSAPSLRARLPRARTVLTLHNLAFQGTGPEAARAAEAAGLSLEAVCRGGNDPNFLRAGILAADRVTTVSPNYAREVLSDAGGLGMGLSPALREASARGAFRGVLNGIDKAAWSPEADGFLPARYSASDVWRGKGECKRQLLREVGLPWEHVGSGEGDGGDDSGRDNPERMLLAVISRLTDQKGLPLILRGIARAISAGAQVVVLGSAPDPAVQRDFERRAAEASQGGVVRFVLRYDEALAHRLYAASDALLVPSLFEPCGLTQLIAMRYGCVPVVRRTGGLADTVFDVAHDHHVPEAQRNGFVFEGDEVEAAVGRAADAYSQGRGWWRGELVPRLMRADHGWARSGREYLDLYREAGAAA